MREKDPIQNDIRKRRWTRRFGPKPICVLCRFDRPEGLVLVPWSMIEGHHVFGKAHNPDVKVPICRNCHAIVTELNRRTGVSMDPPADLLEHVIAVLRALGTFFPLVGDAFFKLADQLSRLTKALDKKYPEWRNMKEGK